MDNLEQLAKGMHRAQCALQLGVVVVNRFRFSEDCRDANRPLPADIQGDFPGLDDVCKQLLIDRVVSCIHDAMVLGGEQNNTIYVPNGCCTTSACPKRAFARSVLEFIVR
jgi:hypothetical protein